MNIREDLKAYVDGELDAARADEIRTAIGASPDLQKEVDLYRSIGVEIREMVREPQVSGLERTLRAVQPRRPWWQASSLGIAVAGALGAVVLGAILFPVFAQSKEAARTTRSYADMTISGEKPENGVDRGILRGEGDVAGDYSSAGKSPSTFYGFQNDPGGGVAASPPVAESPAADAPREDKAKNRRIKGGAGVHSTLPATKSLPEVNRGRSGSALSNPWASSKPADMDGRVDAMIIRTAEIALEVKEVSKAHATITSMVRGFGGYVENSNDSNMKGEQPYATAVLRVPENNFEAVLGRLRKIEPDVEVLNSSMSGEDVTLQFADTESELKTLRGAEKRYRAIMGQTKRIGEVLEVQAKLDDVRTQIEGLESTKKVLQRQSAMSTISVTLHQRSKVGEPEPPQNWSDDAWTTAVNGLYSAGRALGQACIFLFVFSPFWLPPVLVAVWLSKRQVRS